MNSHWYRAAAKVIDEVTAAFPPDADKREVMKAIDDAYPFGARNCWPYKKWLEARRDFMLLRFPDEREKARLKAPVPKDSLFTETR